MLLESVYATMNVRRYAMTKGDHDGLLESLGLMFDLTCWYDICREGPPLCSAQGRVSGGRKEEKFISGLDMSRVQ